MNKIFNIQSKLLNKLQLTESIFDLKYEVPKELIYTAGQFVGARVLPTHTRAYSIVDITDGILTLLVDIKPNGLASQYFEKIQEGDSTNILGPYGIYKEKDTDLQKVFISTGTGIAPYIPIIKKLKKEKPNLKIWNFFGVRLGEHDIAFPYFKELIDDNLDFVRCVTREDHNDIRSRRGRVTEVVPTFDFDWPNTEFYICGGNEMIADMSNVLKAQGADKIYSEKYGIH